MNTTADHVNDSYKSRTETAAEMLAQAQTGEDYPDGSEYEGSDPHDVLGEFPLAVDRKTLITVTLGTGGPSDWIDAVCSTYEGQLGIESATYTAVWGSDRKTTTLYPSDALYQLAEYYVEGMEA